MKIFLCVEFGVGGKKVKFDMAGILGHHFFLVLQYFV
jgi:hypothetical protein